MFVFVLCLSSSLFFFLLCEYSILHLKNMAFFPTTYFFCRDVEISSWLSMSTSYCFSVKEQKKEQTYDFAFILFNEEILKNFFSLGITFCLLLAEVCFLNVYFL